MFTNAGKKSQRAAVTWQVQGQWCHQILEAEPGDSLQTLELAAVVWAFKRGLTVKLNVVSDSLYVAGIVERIEDARIRDISNRRLFELLCQLQSAIGQRTCAYAIIHIRSHKGTEGLGKGNAYADQLVSMTVPLSEFAKA